MNPRKRILEPTLKSLGNLQPQNKDKLKKSLKDILPEFNKRTDCRNCTDLRPVYLKCGVINEARGSAYIEIGNTKAIASVQGPLELANLLEYEQGVLNFDVKFSSFSQSSNLILEEEDLKQDYVTRLTQALNPVVCRDEFPNNQLNICIAILDDDGSSFSASVIVSSIAIANARIAMFDLPITVTVGIYNDIAMLDLTKLEEQFFEQTAMQDVDSNCGTVTVTYMHSMSQITDCNLSGSLKPNKISEGVSLIVENSDKLYKAIQSPLYADAKNSVKNENLKKDIEEGIEKLKNK